MTKEEIIQEVHRLCELIYKLGFSPNYNVHFTTNSISICVFDSNSERIVHAHEYFTKANKKVYTKLTYPLTQFINQNKQVT